MERPIYSLHTCQNHRDTHLWIDYWPVSERRNAVGDDEAVVFNPKYARVLHSKAKPREEPRYQDPGAPSFRQ